MCFKIISKIYSKYTLFWALQMPDLLKKKNDFINISGIREENALNVVQIQLLIVSN